MRLNKIRVVEESAAEAKRFLKVSEAAALLGVDPMTVYRAIQSGGFPAIKVRGRYVIPALALDQMESAALAGKTMVDTADWSTRVTVDQVAAGGST